MKTLQLVSVLLLLSFPALPNHNKIARNCIVLNFLEKMVDPVFVDISYPFNYPYLLSMPKMAKYITHLENDKQSFKKNKKQKSRVHINEIEKVENENVFQFILSRFRGKPMMIDFWATWCGPCQMANQELKTVKEELVNKNIVYIYVAGENSPLETWRNTICNLHGEHFRLTAKQWNYVMTMLSIDGIPTYFFIDRKCHIKNRQTGYFGVEDIKNNLLQIAE